MPAATTTTTNPSHQFPTEQATVRGICEQTATSMGKATLPWPSDIQVDAC